MAAVGTFVLWGKQNLCLVRALDDALVLETLYYAEDIRSDDEIREAVAETEMKAPELRWRSNSWRASRETSIPASIERVPGELEAMLQAKLEGDEIVQPEPAPVAPVSTSWRR